jgi:hypothetical protein
VQGPVSIVVEANDTGAAPANIALFVDNKFAVTLQNQNNTYSATITLSSGPHAIAVSGKDTSGLYLQTSAVFKVQ